MTGSVLPAAWEEVLRAAAPCVCGQDDCQINAYDCPHCGGPLKVTVMRTTPVLFLTCQACRRCVGALKLASEPLPEIRASGYPS